MEAPEKIYLFKNPVSDTPDDRWLSKRSDKKDVEYTCTDAFIEKARVWLEKHTLYAFDLGFGHSFQMKQFIEDFKNYMKEE